MMKRSTKKVDLNPNILFKLNIIFKEKGWNIDSSGNSASVFNRFCSMLRYYDLEEQNLILELTERFTKIGIEDYYSYLKQLLNSFVESNNFNLEEIENVYVSPLISPEDFGKTKSSTMVQYAIRAVIVNVNSLAFKKIHYTEGLELDPDKVNSGSSLLIVVDDFIGTGETACSTIDYLVNEKEINKDKIVILSIASLEIGKEAIERDKQVALYTCLNFKKGITDYYKEDIAKEKLEIMNNIEEKLKIHKNEKLGFKGSEALITLIRTPNNTFPVFWKQKKNKVAPFPR